MGTYVRLDVGLVRVVWIVLPSLGTLLPGVLLYVAGVCSALVEYFDVVPTLVRLLWALLTICGGFVGGALAYAMAWWS